MKLQMKTALVLALALGTSLSPFGAQAESADCGGCDRVQAAQKEFKALPSKTRQAPAALLQKGLESVAKLKLVKGKLTSAQAREIVELLRVSYAFDFGGFILDGNTELVRKNMQTILDEVHRLPSKEAKDIEEAIRVDQESNVSDSIE
jgi:hypothetical protein